jgi:hypothetical protein
MPRTANRIALDWGLAEASIEVPKVSWFWPASDPRLVVWIDAPRGNNGDVRVGNAAGTLNGNQRRWTPRESDRAKTCSALELFLSLDRSERQKLEPRPGPGRPPRDEREWLLRDIRTFIERFGPLRIQPKGRPAPSGVRGGLDASDLRRYPPDMAAILDTVERAAFRIDKQHLAQLLAGTIAGPRSESLIYARGRESPVSRLAKLGESRIAALIDILIEEEELSLVDDPAGGWSWLQRSTALWEFEDMGTPPAEEPDPDYDREFRAAVAADRDRAQRQRDALGAELQEASSRADDNRVVVLLRELSGESDESPHVDAWSEKWKPELDRELGSFFDADWMKDRRVCWEPIEAWLRYAGVVRAVVNEAGALVKAGTNLPSVEESRERFIKFTCGTWRPIRQAHERDSFADPKAWTVPDSCAWEAAREWDRTTHSYPDFGPREAVAVRRDFFSQVRDALVDEAGLALYTTWTAEGKISDALGPRLGTLSAWGLVVAELHRAVTRPFLPKCSICGRPYPKFDRSRTTRQLCCPHCGRVHSRKFQRGDFETA